MNVHIRGRKPGDIPTIRVGRLLPVPVRAMERLLDQSCRDFATAESKKKARTMRARSSSKRSNPQWCVLGSPCGARLSALLWGGGG